MQERSPNSKTSVQQPHQNHGFPLPIWKSVEVTFSKPHQFFMYTGITGFRWDKHLEFSPFTQPFPSAGWRDAKPWMSTLNCPQCWLGISIESGPIPSTYFYKRGHQSSRKIEVGNIWHQAGIVVVHVRGALSPHVRRLPIKSMWGRPKIRVLRPPPGRMLADSRMRQPVPRVVMRRSDFCTEWEG